MYMCDLDDFDNIYCRGCFDRTGCLVSHEEGCATCVFDDGKTPTAGEV